MKYALELANVPLNVLGETTYSEFKKTLTLNENQCTVQIQRSGVRFLEDRLARSH